MISHVNHSDLFSLSVSLVLTYIQSIENLDSKSWVSWILAAKYATLTEPAACRLHSGL